MNKCRLLESTSRDGMGAPPPCALCDLPCPSNILSTVTDLVFAIQSDVMQALRLAAICIGDSGFQKCVCAIAGMLEPHWLKVTTDPLHKCEGDPINNIMSKLLSEAVKIPEALINRHIVLPLKDAEIEVGPFKVKPFDWMDPVCFDLPPWEPDRSRWKPCGNYGEDGNGNTHKCEDDSNGAEHLCYYEVRLKPSLLNTTFAPGSCVTT